MFNKIGEKKNEMHKFIPQLNSSIFFALALINKKENTGRKRF